MKDIQSLFSYISASPAAPGAVAETVRRLREAGYAPLYESGTWNLTAGGKYYTTRGLTSVIAFRLPEKTPTGAMIWASHSDSPTFQVGVAPATRKDAAYTRVSVEKYGGMLAASWFDRPLSLSGLVTVRNEEGIRVIPVTVDRDLLVIPSLAIHMNRTANEDATYRISVDMQPLFGDETAPGVEEVLAEAAGVKKEEILSSEVWLYVREEPRVLGAHGEYILSPRLDDLMCAWGGLSGLTEAKPTSAVQVFALFDHEEVGSSTYQGAASDFLSATLARVTECLRMTEDEKGRFYACSLLASADNAHAVHPNHPEKADPLYAPRMNGGVVIKHNASRRYVTDAVSEALFREICRRAEVPTQDYRNHPDIPGGSTLGCLSNAQVSIRAVDIGMAQLAMHSACETAGSKDAAYVRQAAAAFFGTALSLRETEEGTTLTLA